MVNSSSMTFNQIGNYAMGVSKIHSMLGNVVETGFNLMLVCVKGHASIEIYGKTHKLHLGSILNANWEMQLRFLSASEDFEVFYFLMSEDFCSRAFERCGILLPDLRL